MCIRDRPALDDPALWADFPAEVAALHGRGLAVAAGMQQTIFEMAWGIRGMDDMLCDMLTEPDKAECLFERITVLREAMARRYAAAGVDVLELGDDVGTQRGMMFDPGLWRSLLRGRLARVVDVYKRQPLPALTRAPSPGPTSSASIRTAAWTASTPRRSNCPSTKMCIRDRFNEGQDKIAGHNGIGHDIGPHEVPHK